jgi:Ca-activated chloride channel family protein
MTLLRPDLAPWALVIPVIIACWALHRHLRVAFGRRSPVAPRFAALSRRTGRGRDGAVLAAGLLTAGALSMALMRPQAPLTRRVPQYRRQDLVIVLDRSASMQARDIVPSRSARATLELRNFIRHKPEGIGRVALIGFADSPVVLSYPTEDADSFMFFLDWIDQDRTLFIGTNLGAALDTAMEVARKNDPDTEQLLLVISDGEDFGSDLGRALLTAKARHYRVNCIGVGGDAAVPIPVTEPGGGTVLRDDTGRAVTTRFSETTLRRVAAETGGQYARSTTGEELQRAIASLVDRDRRVIGWRTSSERRELYPLCLAIAAAAVAMLWVLL